MIIQELKARLKEIEWNDVEFKEAQNEVPKSAYETVSAFANTHGGWLIFGVSQKSGEFEILGVSDPERIQNDFLSALHADNKVNHDIRVKEKMLKLDGKTVLAFYIFESSRVDKPICLNGDIRRSFVRRGGGDYQCSMNEIGRFLRDASSERWDGGLYNFPLNEAFDSASLKWYRTLFNDRNPGHDAELSDEDFLYQWGYLFKGETGLVPTRSAIMLFGSAAAIHHIIPRPVLDVQWIPANLNDPMPETPWYDRVVYEENVISTWRGLVQKYMQHEPRPFRGIDPHTLMRDDTPPGYRVFREAAINLLIHQDYADHSRKAVIKFYRDVIQFWNPGDVFGTDADLLQPGEKEVRNPNIAAAFRRLALCEQAGTGIGMMTTQWQKIGHPAPMFINDRGKKAFEIKLGVAAKKKKQPMSQPKLQPDSRPESRQLHSQPQWRPHSKTQPELQPESISLKSKVLTVLGKGNFSKAEISKRLGQKEISGQLNKAMRELVAEKAIERTIPGKPQSRLQKYKLK